MVIKRESINMLDKSRNKAASAYNSMWSSTNKDNIN